MQLNVLTTFIFLIMFGLFVPMHSSNAVVIKSTDKAKKNYEIHHRVIIYNNLSTYLNTDKKQNLISQQSSNFNFFDTIKTKDSKSQNFDNSRLTRFPISHSTSKNQSGFQFNNIGNNDYEEIPIGSFLDNFKDDPILQTIYFTSKDLIFGYKRKIANVMQIGFDMEAKKYNATTNFWSDRTETKEIQLTQEDQNAIKQENRILFGFIKESYKNIILVMLTMVAALLISFRYILNKYI